MGEYKNISRALLKNKWKKVKSCSETLNIIIVGKFKWFEVLGGILEVVTLRFLPESWNVPDSCRI